jgi:cation diffusion facilitator family transporter
MHAHSLKDWQHDHNFALTNSKAERRTHLVLMLTAVTMVAEIIAGTLYGSMALLADGWHMATHVAAFLITLFTYRYARKHTENPDYSFGTGKVNVLGGFASAVALAVVALMMLVESLERIASPQAIHFNEAIVVASIGLLVNVISVFLLKDDHDHHGHGHGHGEQHSHHDHNLRAAYLHVLADAMTSLLAIIALVLGKLWGWQWLDPIMGIVGAVIITRWAYGLVKQTSPILLDSSIDANYRERIKTAIENDADNRITDMHIWRVSGHHYAAIISLVTHHPKNTEHYKSLLLPFDRLAHITVEVNRCEGDPCV